MLLSQPFPIVSYCDENNICTCERLDSLALNENHLTQILDTLQTYSIKDTAFLACCYHQLAIGTYYEDDLLKSLTYNKKAEQLRLKFNDGLLWRSQLNLGINYYDLDEYKFANEYLLKAYFTEGIKEYFDSLNIYQKLGNCYAYSGDFEKGLEYGKSAVNIKVDTDVEDLNYAKNDLAKILIETNLPERIKLSIDYSEQVLNISKDQDNIMLALINLANAYVLLEKYDEALKYYKKGLSISKHDTINLCIILNNIGTLLMDGYQLEYTAIDTLKNTLNLYHSYYETNYTYDYAAPHENLADNYTALQQFDTALRHYQKALINLTNNFRTENIYQNPNPKDSTLFIYSNQDIIRVLHLKASVAYQYYQQNKQEKYLTLANQTYQTAFNFHNKLQQDISTENSRLFQAKNIVPYIENALKIAYQQQENGQDISNAAFRFMEKNKATVLVQSMNEANALQFANLPDSLLTQEKDLKIAISFHNKQLNEAIEYEDSVEVERLDKIIFEEKQQYNQLINNLENNYPNYYRLKYQQNQTELTDIQNQLDNETAILEYFVGDSAIYILSIQKNQSALYQIEKYREWQQVINNFRLALTDSLLLKDGVDRYHGIFAESGHQLYQWLLSKPFNDVEKEINRLQIIPDAELNSIPFELLLTEAIDTTQISYKKLPYLLRNKSVGYLYAGAFLQDNQKKVSKDTLLSLAGFSSNYENSAFGALPYSQESVSSIAQKFRGHAFIKATKKIFMDEAYKYKTLLFAMHAKLDDKNAMNSALIFSQTEDSLDFQLRAADLYNTSLNAEMAVLSACETGVGKINKGEGVMSLSRAFTYAGCPSLVMSLWSIPNKSTSQVTKSFFNNLDKGLTKDLALQQAKLTYLESVPDRDAHPIYWGGLVATGDLSPVDISGQSNCYLLWIIILLLVLGLSLCWFYNRQNRTN